MQTSQTNALEWEGGSIEDLVQMLATPALAVRVEVRTPSAGKPRKVGEIHMVAGGVYETIAGELRGDDAMEHLRGVSPLSFRLQPRLPNPDDGGLLIPGPGEGTLAERPPAELMRYCELYVLTCTLEIWRDTDRASIDYTKGDITQTIVNGLEASDRLAEVINWDSGGYRIVLPELSLPEPPKPVARVQTASQPSRVVPTNIAAAPSAPVAVQTASPRVTQVFTSPSVPVEARPVATTRGTPARPIQARESAPSPVAKVAAASPAPAPSTSPAPQAIEPPAPRIVARESGVRESVPTVDPVLAKAAAPKDKAELVKVEPAKPAEGRKTESRKTESKKAEGKRNKGKTPEKSIEVAEPKLAAQPEASMWPAILLGLAVGLALAAIYWIYRATAG